jgi:hypothetical protein
VLLVVLIDRLIARYYIALAPASGRRALEAMLAENKSLKAGYFQQHPYLYYTYLPGYRDFGFVQFNSLGHRSPEVSLLPAPGTLRILCEGGSTTASFPYIKNPAMAWPAQLGRLLEHRSGLKVEVINAGLNNANIQVNLLHYLFRNRYLRPHIVILETGLNDGAALLHPHYNPEYTHFITGWRPPPITLRPHEAFLLRSHIIKLMYAYWLSDLSLDSTLGHTPLFDLSPSDCLKNATSSEPEGFRRDLDLMLRCVMQDGGVPVVIPTPYAPESVFRKTPKLGNYYDALSLSYEKSAKVIEEVTTILKVRSLTIPKYALPAEDFVDFCHLNEKGDSIKASMAAETLLPLINDWINSGWLLQPRLSLENRTKPTSQNPSP